MIEKIKKMYKPTKNCINEYKELFKQKDYFVINYNYSTFNEEMFKYYKPEDCYHIHNKITPQTSLITTNDNKTDILLGWYKNEQKPIVEIDWKWLGLKESDEYKEKLSLFSKLIGNEKNFFDKSIPLGVNKWDPINVGKSFKKIEEAVIIGHSVNDNDFNNIHNRIEGLKLNKIKKIYYYGYWNTKDEKNKINDQINHYFKAAGKEVVFNKWNKDNHTYEIG